MSKIINARAFTPARQEKPQVAINKPIVKPANVNVVPTSEVVMDKKKFKDCGSNSEDDKVSLNYGVVVPNDDRFVPFSLTIHVGDTVTWKNNDTDDHTVVSDDVINSAQGPQVDDPLASGETLTLQFNDVGQWVYYCRIHATLDAFNQPISRFHETPSLGNQDQPMMGVITILPRD